MKGTCISDYVKNGKDMFVYSLTCTEEEKAQVKEAKGEFYKEDSKGNPLFWTDRYVGDNVKFLVTTNGNIVPDTSELKKMASLARQYGGNLGDQFAAAAASNILAKMRGGRIDNGPVETHDEPQDKKEPEDETQAKGLDTL